MGSCHHQIIITRLGCHCAQACIPSCGLSSLPFALLLGLFSKPFFHQAVQILLMATDMDTTRAWHPDEGFLSDLTRMSSIKAQIISYIIKLAHSDNDIADKSFIGPFSQMLLQLERTSEPMKKIEALK